MERRHSYEYSLAMEEARRNGKYWSDLCYVGTSNIAYELKLDEA